MSKPPITDQNLESTEAFDHPLANSGEEHDSTGLFEVSAVRPDEELGPYRLIREIGRGAMGAVYEAEHTKLRRRVAIKMLPIEFTAIPARLSRFQREMEAIGRLDHENIVRAHDAGEFNGTHYLAMELIEGHDVQELMNRVGRIDIGSACEIARQTALGLQHIAEHRLVHRDIKPSNLLMNAAGTVKILDLGIVRLRRDEKVDSSQTSIGSMIGTPDYMAPEQIESSCKVDIRADIYSLGCTLYTMLAGRPPFHGEEFDTQMSKLMAHVKQDPPALSEVADHVPHGLTELVRRLMAKDVSDRIQDPEEVANALAEWADADSLKRLSNTALASDTVVGRYQKERDNGEFGALDGDRQLATKLKWALVAGVGALLVGMFAVGPSSDPMEEPTARSTSLAETLPTSTASSNPIAPTNSRDVTVPSESLETLATSTSEIAANSSKVAKSTDNIDQNTKKMVGALEELRDTFRAAVRSGTIVSEPKSVGEFYHNAQAYQMQGKLGDAQKMYLSVFEHGGDFVDVHQQFQSLLISQHDEAEIREIYASLPGDNGNVVRQYALALTESDPDVREKSLRDLLVEDATFAPAAYELSRLCSADVLGRQGLSDKRNERRWLTVFRTLSRDGHLTEYFLDPTKATELTAEAAQRWVAVRDIDEAVFETPVAANLMASRGATTIMISIGEPTTEIRYRIDQKGEFKSTGHLAVLNPVTGRSAPKTLVNLPPNTKPSNIEIEYTDIRNESQGPHLIELGQKAIDQDSRNKLDLMSTYWVKFVNRRGNQFIDLQSLAVYRNVIKEVRYGLNAEEPNEIFQLADPRENGIKNRIQLDDGGTEDVAFASVQLQYTDGTESPVQVFKRADHLR